jgi:putative membrane protein
MSGLFIVLIPLMVVLILLCLVLFYVRHKPHKLPPPQHEAQLLKEQYTRGEISEEDYRKRVKELNFKPSAGNHEDSSP